MIDNEYKLFMLMGISTVSFVIRNLQKTKHKRWLYDVILL